MNVYAPGVHKEDTIRWTVKVSPEIERRGFLQACDDQPRPETVESFIKTCQRHGTAPKIVGTTLPIECQGAETAAMIATPDETSGLYLCAGDRRLVVRLEHEEQFRSLMRILGVGMTT